MSCYNWESGSFRLSTVEYAKFRHDFGQGFNELQETELAAATRHWEKYKSGPLPKWWSQNSIAENEQYEQFNEEKQRFYKIWQKWIAEPGQTEETKNWGKWEDRKRPRKPIRKDYPLVTRYQTAFPLDEGGIDFKTKAREVYYYSGENNHQVERAREHEVGQLFFRLLGQVKWTRGTGGQLIGNDEYNQDSNEAGGGGNYTTLTYPTHSDNLKRLSRLS